MHTPLSHNMPEKQDLIEIARTEREQYMRVITKETFATPGQFRTHFRRDDGTILDFAESMKTYLSKTGFIVRSEELTPFYETYRHSAHLIYDSKFINYQAKTDLEWDIKEILQYNFDVYAEVYQKDPKKIRPILIENLKKFIYTHAYVRKPFTEDLALIHTETCVNIMIFQLAMLTWYQTFPHIPFFAQDEFEKLLPAHMPYTSGVMLDTNETLVEHMNSRSILWNFTENFITDEMKDNEQQGKDMILNDTSIKATHKGAKRQMYHRMLIEEIRMREKKAVEKLSLFYKTFTSPDEIPNIAFHHTWNNIPLYIEVMTQINGISISQSGITIRLAKDSTVPTSFSITQDKENEFYYSWPHNTNELFVYLPVNNFKLKPIEYMIQHMNPRYQDDDGLTITSLMTGQEGGIKFALDLLEVIADGIYEILLPMYLEKTGWNTDQGTLLEEDVSEIMEEETQDAIHTALKYPTFSEQNIIETTPTHNTKLLIPYKKFLFKLHALPKNKPLFAPASINEIYKQHSGTDLPKGYTLRRLYYRKALTFAEANTILEKYFGLIPNRQQGSHMTASRVLPDGTIKTAVLLNKTKDSTKSLESALEQAEINEDLFYQVVRLLSVKKGNQVSIDAVQNLLEGYAQKINKNNSTYSNPAPGLCESDPQSHAHGRQES